MSDQTPGTSSAPQPQQPPGQTINGHDASADALKPSFHEREAARAAKRAKGWRINDKGKWIKPKDLAKWDREEQEQRAERRAKAENDDWDAPLPLPGDFAGSDIADKALLALAGPTAKGEIEDKIKNLKTPVAMAAMGTFAAVAALMQDLFDVVHPETGARMPTSMFGLLVATASERKTTSDEASFSAIDKYEEAERETHRNKVTRQKRELALWKDEEKKLRLAVANAQPGIDRDAAEGAYLALRPEPPTPRYIKFRVEDASKEALQDSFGHRTSRFLSSGEGTKVFGGHALSAEQAGGTLGTWNDMWNGIVGGVERIGRETHDETDGRLSIWIQVHPAFLKAFLKAAGSMMKAIGALSRFNLLWPVSTKGTRLVDESERAASADWSQRDKHQEALAHLVKLLLARGRGAVRTALHVPASVRPVWAKFHNEVERQMAPYGSMEESSEAAGKAGEHALRWASIAWLTDQLSNAEQIGAEVKPWINADQMARGVSVARAMLTSQTQITKLAREEQGVDEARDLEAWIRTKGGKTTRTQLLQFGPNALRGKAKLDPALEALVALERVRVEGTAIVLNPRLGFNNDTRTNDLGDS